MTVSLTPDVFPTIKQASADFAASFPREKEPEGTRRADGTFAAGGGVKRRKLRSNGLSSSLQRFMLARFGNPRVFYEWLIDIAADDTNRPTDRLKAIEMIAERVDGKPTTAVELSGPKGKPVEVTSNVSAALTTPERLAAVAEVFGTTGALALIASTGGAGSGAHSQVEQVPPADR